MQIEAGIRHAISKLYFIANNLESKMLSKWNS